MHSMVVKPPGFKNEGILNRLWIRVTANGWLVGDVTPTSKEASWHAVKHRICILARGRAQSLHYSTVADFSLHAVVMHGNQYKK